VKIEPVEAMEPMKALDEALARLNFQIGVHFCALHANTMWEFELLRRKIRKSLV